MVSAILFARGGEPVAVTQRAPDDAPEPEVHVCGACARLMPDPDGWHTLPLPAHPAAPTLVCAPCHAAGRMLH